MAHLLRPAPQSLRIVHARAARPPTHAAQLLRRVAIDASLLRTARTVLATTKRPLPVLCDCCGRTQITAPSQSHASWCFYRQVEEENLADRRY